MTKMTMKNNVAEIRAYLSKAGKTKAVKANDVLYRKMAETSKALKDGQKVTKKALLSLADECFGTIEAYAETSKKQTAKPKGEASVKKAPAKKKPEKKTAEQSKKAPAKKSKEAPKKAPAKKEAPLVFPVSFEDDEYKYIRADDIDTLDAVRESLENEEEIIVASHWTQDDLKKFDYANGLVKKPRKFDNDLDLLTVVYAGDRANVFYGVSLYTEGMYVFRGGRDIKPDKNGRRVSNSLPYSIYRAEEK